MVNVTFRPRVEDRDTEVVYDLVVRDVETGHPVSTALRAVGGTSALRIVQPCGPDGAAVDMVEVLGDAPVTEVREWADGNEALSLAKSPSVTELDVDFGCVVVAATTVSGWCWACLSSRCCARLTLCRPGASKCGPRAP